MRAIVEEERQSGRAVWGQTLRAGLCWGRSLRCSSSTMAPHRLLLAPRSRPQQTPAALLNYPLHSTSLTLERLHEARREVTLYETWVVNNRAMQRNGRFDAFDDQL